MSRGLGISCGQSMAPPGCVVALSHRNNHGSRVCWSQRGTGTWDGCWSSTRLAGSSTSCSWHLSEVQKNRQMFTNPTSTLIFLLGVGHTGQWVAFSHVCPARVSSSGFGRKSSKFAKFGKALGLEVPIPLKASVILS